jgi:hypothetical protein
MRYVWVFKMVTVDSGYVGTEPVIDRVGRFNCVCETVKKSKNDDTKTENEVICKLTVPNGYHFKEGFMISFDSDEQPEMKIISVSKYTSHSVCECITWK